MKSQKRQRPPRGQIDIYAPRTNNGRRPGIFHIIFRTISSNNFVFGHLVGNAKVPPGEKDCCEIELTKEGKITNQCIVEWAAQTGQIRILAHCIMPTHVHILIEVDTWLEYHIDNYLGNLKIQIEDALSNIKELHGPAFKFVFHKKYFERHIPCAPLQIYIRSNPHRLGMRIQYPKFFETVRTISIYGITYQALGNLFLLRNPDKLSFRISDEWGDWKKKQSGIIYRTHLNSEGILVSPLFSCTEKEFIKEAKNTRRKLILITSASLTFEFTRPLFLENLDLQRDLLVISAAPYTEIRSAEHNTILNAADNLYTLADTIASIS